MGQRYVRETRECQWDLASSKEREVGKCYRTFKSKEGSIYLTRDPHCSNGENTLGTRLQGSVELETLKKILSRKIFNQDIARIKFPQKKDENGMGPDRSTNQGKLERGHVTEEISVLLFGGTWFLLSISSATDNVGEVSGGSQLALR